MYVCKVLIEVLKEFVQLLSIFSKKKLVREFLRPKTLIILSNYLKIIDSILLKIVDFIPQSMNIVDFIPFLMDEWLMKIDYSSDFRYESNGILVLGVGFFSFRQISTF